MPLYILSKEHNLDEIILERRLNIIIVTVCWSLGSKMILPTIVDLSSNPNLIHVNFYRIDIDDNNQELTQRLKITTIPTIQWYFHGNKLDELNGVDLAQFLDKTHRLAMIYKRKTDKQTSSSLNENHIFESMKNKTS